MRPSFFFERSPPAVLADDECAKCLSTALLAIVTCLSSKARIAAKWLAYRFSGAHH